MRISDWSSDVCSSDLQASARCTDYDPVSLGPQRLPEHDVGQKERQAALGHAPEVLAGLQGSRRLAGQEGVLAVVHDRVSLQQELKEARSEEHTSELQSLMRISYAVFCLKKQQIIPKTKQRIINW